MKKLVLLLLAAPLLLLASCGNSYRDLYGKWEFSNITYDDPAAAAKVDAFEFEQTKDLFRGMTYHFKDEEQFTLVTPNLNDELLSGTFSLENGGDELVLKYTNGEKRFIIKKLEEKKLVLQEIQKGNKTEDKVSFVYTR